MDSTVSKQQERTKHAVKRIIVIAAFPVAALIVGGYVIVHSRVQDTKNGSIITASKPTFPTVLPRGISIEKLGGWQQLKGPNGNAVFVYADKIDNVSISVSQQPLPGSFKQNASGDIEKLAKNYNATNTINAKGTKAYIGTSAKGPQSVIFTKKSLLILIKSQENISNKAWAKYIASLV